jgi:hypothetical protein
MTGIWDDETETILRTLWAENLSFSEIAKRIKGATRNSVAGKAYRLKLPPRKPVWPGPRPKSPAAAKRAA